MSDDPPIPDGFLAQWCQALAVGTEMPPPAYLATGLVSVAAIVGPRLFIRFSQTRRERCNLWVGNVGRSAMARKTTGMSAARWAVKVAAETLGDSLRWYAPKRMSDAQMAMDLDVVGVDTAVARQKEAAAAKAEGREPVPVAPVKRPVPVSWCMAINELAGMWGDGGREWQQATQALLLELFDGELASNTRQSFVPAQETFVCALGNIPPSELTAHTSLGLLTSGFAGRWLILRSPAPTVPIAIPSLNGTDQMRDLAGHVVQLARLAEGARGVDAVSLWTDEARRIRTEWYEGHWRELRAADPESREASARADLYMRLQATAMKLATIVAVTRRGAYVARLEDVSVDASDVVWAQDRVEESIRTLMDAVHEAGGGATSNIGKVENRVVHYLERMGADCEDKAVSLNQVAKAVKHSDGHRDVVHAIEGLVGSGRVGMDEGRTGPRGGRPARVLWLA